MIIMLFYLFSINLFIVKRKTKIGRKSEFLRIFLPIFIFGRMYAFKALFHLAETPPAVLL